MKFCETCKIGFEPSNNRQRFCKECAKKRLRQANRKCAKKRKEVRENIGPDIDIDALDRKYLERGFGDIYIRTGVSLMMI